MPRPAARLDRPIRTSLAAFRGGRPAILAWAPTADGWVIGTPGSLVVGDGQSWQRFPWHQVATGQWESGTGRLSWVDAEGTGYKVVLEQGGRFADLFNERVSASVVVSRQVDLGAGRHATLALRRNLEPGTDETSWEVVAAAGVDLTNPATQARIDQELASAQEDFGLA